MTSTLYKLSHLHATIYHAGDGQGKGNRASIGIEICYSQSAGPKYVYAEANAVDYNLKLKAVLPQIRLWMSSFFYLSNSRGIQMNKNE
ncbi:hypothetical protein AZE41_10765 [Sporosarcina psychrophila]|nr:hypothetical protein AZE41_10765 [Sporosarcina psychrophila]